MLNYIVKKDEDNLSVFIKPKIKSHHNISAMTEIIVKLKDKREIKLSDLNFTDQINSLHYLEENIELRAKTDLLIEENNKLKCKFLCMSFKSTSLIYLKIN